MDSKLWAEEFNRHNPPKKIDIFQMCVLEFPDENQPFYHMERYIEGEYIKYNSNSGFVSGIHRKTPQASGEGYGNGNLGTKGMALFFHSHLCNDICRSMCLTEFDLAETEKTALLEGNNPETVIFRLLSSRGC
ncbi:unnamed protein product [Gongylonema pulchrum]|uniref:Alpha-type protein kinase domain-containing protein n=1 Tax=Gongylonema pulchrum TaxID=637853 RepID=A0A183EUC9_9BILA|nr:unnamed protein product [Gongylonema pulchrum]